jgi:D-alanyl-D-alanine dipeptidase/carboxypeptidase
MKKLILPKENIHRGNLVLVNREHALKVSREKGVSLARVESVYARILLEIRTATMLSALIEMLSAKGRIIPISGYRSRKEQERIYVDSLAENGKAYTEKYVAQPDCSEHQTGLAIDVAQKGDNIDFICPDFPNSGICHKFRRYAAQFGFVERYMESKEEITGIGYEPWHFRYVGYPHSTIMEREGMVLEEYVDFVRQFDARAPLNVMRADSHFDIFYVPAEAEETILELPDGLPYQLSGNNVDGFIVTLWRQTA